ncbi:hypothetical protein E2C01_078815 [Portunus trituberculatus]|uniref:Uncharacterized protein n=1 Tax=Portunus trituberculatus TaxID=210409 RepID=A0A5B7IPR0_PORTR|nr:hypothetical protein [Portunus trituberculatus]
MDEGNSWVDERNSWVGDVNIWVRDRDSWIGDVVGELLQTTQPRFHPSPSECLPGVPHTALYR